MVMRWKQCKNKGTVKRGGKFYCHLHDPEMINERQDKRDEKKKKKDDLRRKMYLAHLAGKKRLR
jgi:hypothetical protein